MATSLECPGAEEPRVVEAGDYSFAVQLGTRRYTGAASYFRLSNGLVDCSSVLLFPDSKYLAHQVEVDRGITTWRAHGHLYRIGGRHVVITDHTFAWIKILADELPVKAYANSSALQTAVAKILKKAHEVPP